MVGIQELTLVVSLSILIVSAYNLYLGHLKEKRSEVALLQQASEDGNFASGSRTRWNGTAPLKIVNSGEKGATIGSIKRSLVGLRKGDELVETENVEIKNRSGSAGIRRGDQIQPKSTIGWTPGLVIECDDPEYLVEHDSAVVRHTLLVEDNQGAYECTQEMDMALYGPSMIRREHDVELPE